MMRVIILRLLLMVTASLALPAYAVTFGPFENSVGQAVPDDSCGSAEVTRSFTVGTSPFTVDSILVGINATHDYRGVFRIRLQGPDGNNRTIKNVNNNHDANNYDITINDTSGVNPNSGGNHNTGAPFYENVVGPRPNGRLDAFIGETGNGVWTISVCDNDPDVDNGFLNRVQLTIEGTLAVTVATISKSFTPASIAARDNTTLRFTVVNTNASTALTGVNFTDNMPAALSLANTTLTQSCTAGGGGFALSGASSGDSNITINGGTLNGGETCTIDVTVTSNTLGTFNNTASGVNSTESAVGAVSNTASLTVTAITAASISKAFATSPIIAATTTTLAFTVTNPNATKALSSVNFTDNMPAGLLLNTNTLTLGGGSSAGCSGFTASGAGTSVIAVTGGNIPAGGSCIIQAVVEGDAQGSFVNIAGGVNANETNQGANSASASLVVSPLPAASITKAYLSSPINSGANSIIRYTLSNPNAAALSAVVLEDNLPASLTLNALTIGGTCTGFAFSGTAIGANDIVLNSGAIPASGSCTVEVTITGSASGTYTNTADGVNAAETLQGAASNSASITVVSEVDKSFTPAIIAADQTAILRFTFNNNSGANWTGVGLSDNMPDAMWVDSLTLGGTCTGFVFGASSALGDENFSLSGGTVNANSSCTVDVQVKSNVPGTHTNTVANFVRSGTTAAVGASASLTVTDSLSASCTPGDSGSGSIFMNFEDDIYSVNLQTAKATLLTTSPLVTELNSLAIDPANYLVYYAAETGNTSTNNNLYVYDIVTNTHSVMLTPNGDVFAGLVGAKGLSSGGASFYNGSLYLGVEDLPVSGDDSILRVELSDDGRSVLYANSLIDFPANQYGDVVVSSGHLNFFIRGGTTQFVRIALTDFGTELLRVGAPAVQGGAQRDGTSLWNISSVLGQTNTTTGAITTFRTITTDGTTQVGTAYDAAGCVPTTNIIGDLFRNYTDGDVVSDPGEPGIPGVTVTLYYDINNDGQLTTADDWAEPLNGVIDNADKVVQTTTDTNGYYTFDNVVPDDYLVVITDDNNVLTGAAKTFTSTDPANDLIPVDVELLDAIPTIDFGYQYRIDIKGIVLNDRGGAVATNAHNTVLDTGEFGISGVKVSAFESDGTTLIASTLTAADGTFQLLVPLSFQNSNIIIREEDLVGYVSVNENIGNSGATNPNTTDNDILISTGTNVDFNSLVFSDVINSAFTTNNNAVINASEVIDYTHQFTTNTAGDVAFTISTVEVPTGLAWNDLIYDDANCNGLLDSGESIITGFTGLLVGNTRCIIHRVSSPSNAAIGSIHNATLTATFDFANITLTEANIVTDLTNVGVNDLALSKTVQNLGPLGTNLAAPVGTTNDADPGDILRYVVTFTNNSVSSLTNLKINDSTPSFTHVNDTDGNGTAVECPSLASVPSLMTCTVLTSSGANIDGYQGPITWQFGVNEGLDPGISGSVTFDVKVE